MPAVERGIGLALLFGGGEALVRGAVALAHRLGLAKAVVGATVVGFGTSAPELAVAVDAGLTGHGATGLARHFGVSEATIGLTLAAVGTSLPELAAGAAAARRHHPEVSVGNVLGSNVFNQLGIAGAATLVAPLAAPPEVARADLWTMLALMVATVAGLLSVGRLGRAPAFVGLLLCATWLAFRM